MYKMLVGPFKVECCTVKVQDSGRICISEIKMPEHEWEYFKHFKDSIFYTTFLISTCLNILMVKYSTMSFERTLAFSADAIIE
jgi:hypothetical protein